MKIEIIARIVSLNKNKFKNFLTLLNATSLGLLSAKRSLYVWKCCNYRLIHFTM